MLDDEEDVADICARNQRRNRSLVWARLTGNDLPRPAARSSSKLFLLTAPLAMGLSPHPGGTWMIADPGVCMGGGVFVMFRFAAWWGLSDLLPWEDEARAFSPCAAGAVLMLRDGMRDDTVGEDMVGNVTPLPGSYRGRKTEPKSKNRGPPTIRRPG